MENKKNIDFYYIFEKIKWGKIRINYCNLEDVLYLIQKIESSEIKDKKKKRYYEDILFFIYTNSDKEINIKHKLETFIIPEPFFFFNFPKEDIEFKEVHSYIKEKVILNNENGLEIDLKNAEPFFALFYLFQETKNEIFKISNIYDFIMQNFNVNKEKAKNFTFRLLYDYPKTPDKFKDLFENLKMLKEIVSEKIYHKGAKTFIKTIFGREIEITNYHSYASVLSQFLQGSVSDFLTLFIAETQHFQPVLVKKDAIFYKDKNLAYELKDFVEMVFDYLIKKNKYLEFPYPEFSIKELKYLFS